eukprot:6296759-Prymnesium_polylepis.1
MITLSRSSLAMASWRRSAASASAPRRRARMNTKMVSIRMQRSTAAASTCAGGSSDCRKSTAAAARSTESALCTSSRNGGRAGRGRPASARAASKGEGVTTTDGELGACVSGERRR